MQTSLSFFHRAPRRVVLGLSIGWSLIAAKCVATPWVIAHWQIPIHPGIIIGPTLLFAALVTLLVATHDWKSE